MLRCNTPKRGRILKSHVLRFSTSSVNFRPPFPGAKSNIALSNSQRDDLVKRLRVVNKKVNSSIAILSQKRIDSSIVTKAQKLNTILDQVWKNLDELNAVYSEHVMVDKPKGRSVLHEKLIQSGKFTEEEARELLKK